MEEIFITKIFEKVAAITKRVRATLLILGTAFVLFTISFYNSWQSGWYKSRIAVHEDQLKWLVFLTDTNYCSEAFGVPPTIPKEERKEFERARTYYIKLGYTPEILKANLINYQRAKIENILLIKVPFFGIAFDINDLALVSGITFLILLSYLLYGLLLKLNDLNAVFELIKYWEVNEKIKSYAYVLLKSNQTLTIKPVTNVLPNITFLSIFPKLIYTLPTFLLAIIIIHDVYTKDLGGLLNPDFAFISLLWSVGIGIALAVVTSFIWYVQGKIDLLWKRIGEEADKFSLKVV